MINVKMVNKADEPYLYTVDADKEDQDKVIEFRRAIKKSIPISVAQMPCDFQVETATGVAIGKKGDWLMHGIDGEYYPCPDAAFKLTYDLTDQLQYQKGEHF